jgi:hypothetical protein
MAEIALYIDDADLPRVLEAFGQNTPEGKVQTDYVRERIGKYVATVTLQYEREKAMKEFQPKDLSIK